MYGYAGVLFARILLSGRQTWTVVSHPKLLWCKIVGHDYDWLKAGDEDWCCRRCGWYDEGGSFFQWLRGRWYRLTQLMVIDMRDGDE